MLQADVILLAGIAPSTTGENLREILRADHHLGDHFDDASWQHLTGELAFCGDLHNHKFHRTGSIVSLCWMLASLGKESSNHGYPQ
jgi:hypothetical protein